jgi:hypothetical protein
MALIEKKRPAADKLDAIPPEPEVGEDLKDF